MPLKNLSKSTKLVRVSNAVAAGAADITPANGVDMTGFNAVMFVFAFGAIVSGAATSVKAADSDDDSTYNDITGTSITVLDTYDNQLVYLDLVGPKHRYIKPLVLRATQNSTLDGIIAILYDPIAEPTTHDATTVAKGEFHINEVDGTA